MTMMFNGTRKKFIVVERVSSGTYFPRRYPIAGQKIPTHTSKTMNAMKIESALPGKMTGMANVQAEIKSTPLES